MVGSRIYVDDGEYPCGCKQRNNVAILCRDTTTSGLGALVHGSVTKILSERGVELVAWPEGKK